MGIPNLSLDETLAKLPDKETPKMSTARPQESEIARLTRLWKNELLERSRQITENQILRGSIDEKILRIQKLDAECDKLVKIANEWKTKATNRKTPDASDSDLEIAAIKESHEKEIKTLHDQTQEYSHQLHRHSDLLKAEASKVIMLTKSLEAEKTLTAGLQAKIAESEVAHAEAEEDYEKREKDYTEEFHENQKLTNDFDTLMKTHNALVEKVPILMQLEAYEKNLPIRNKAIEALTTEVRALIVYLQDHAKGSTPKKKIVPSENKIESAVVTPIDIEPSKAKPKNKKKPLVIISPDTETPESKITPVPEELGSPVVDVDESAYNNPTTTDPSLTTERKTKSNIKPGVKKSKSPLPVVNEKPLSSNEQKILDYSYPHNIW